MTPRKKSSRPWGSFMRLTILPFMISVFCLHSNAMSAEADFAITEDFMQVCGSDYATLDDLKSTFVSQGWTRTGKDLDEALTPDDMLTRVKGAVSYERTYDDGSG